MTRLDDGTLCRLCHCPAKGFATINGDRYCHDDDEDCYSEALYQRGLTMRAPREDTLPGLEETR
jgi:hypothetical protein